MGNRVFWPLLLAGALFLGGCQPGEARGREPETGVTLLLAAASSLEYAFSEALLPMFEERNPTIRVEGIYDSSGRLQTQMEQGLEADLFFSAATKQMEELDGRGYMDSSSIVELLENKIVLIRPAGMEGTVTGFEDLVQAEEVALGDPESVPVGQYAKEVLEFLGIWEEVSPRASFGANVTEVLGWVAQGSAQVGIVYATDAATTRQVEVIAQAPEGSLSTKVLYPVGTLSASAHPEEAQLLLEFLQTPEALAVFEEYGFSPNR